ncbi:hypothetical protein SAMN04487997_2991 [Frateuria terrea]|uniref:Uncharacterized protein n=1 Tax=Frateuria terrea TaxID=529704 RepID=A0A1H6XT16_9GAMM|nr:hypothetical protein SAMN04487997_2991 [Frateuria terrea]SFP51619.1 hypothetical protein SAMN02927913_2450 [Frateuria terrea]
MGANHRHGGQPRAGGGSIPDLTTSIPFFGFLSAAVKRLDRTQLPPPRCSNLITSVPFIDGRLAAPLEHLRDTLREALGAFPE